MNHSPGKRLKQLIQAHPPLQIVGTINAYSAKLAKAAGCQAIYLSGAGVANASLGLPDLGLINLNDVVQDASRITDACDLPLLVDVDTGFGNQFGIARTVRLLERAGVAGIQIEDQILEKRCGHRPNKQVVSIKEMEDRLQAALEARTNPDFMIIARTDAYAIEGLPAALERTQRYEAVGADAIFPEALGSLDAFRSFHQALSLPILANATEFGKTPLFNKEEFMQAGVSMILYPLSAFRAMSKAALNVYEAIVQLGTQKALLSEMQTREELYHILNYHDFENKMDEGEKS